MWDSLFKALPLSILRFLSPFRVTHKNLSIAFPDLTDHELDLIAKESYKETLKSMKRNGTKVVGPFVYNSMCRL